MSYHCSRAVLAIMSAAILTSVIGAPTRGAAQTTSADHAPTCEASEHRQFDFWLGRWEVSTPDGRVVGRSAITKTLDGCVIHERWDALKTQGESFNIWDRTTGRWHQTWVDTQGQLLLLEGMLQDGVMRLSGDSGPPEERVSNRISWTPSADGTVNQRWEVSPDQGKTWKVVFDGTYRPRQPDGAGESSR